MSIKKYFDKNWKNINFSKEKKEHIEVILYFIEKYLNEKNLNYFEFGCGNCYVTNFLYDRLKDKYEKINFEVSDISKVGLSCCSNLFKKILVKEKKRSFTEIYNSKNLVSSFEVLEHLEDDLEEFYCNELLKISKDYILIGVPYQESLEKRNVICKSCAYDGHIYGHLRSYDMDKFSSLFGDKAKLLEYKLCGIIEKDFNKSNYLLAKEMNYKVLNFICPSCTQEQNDITFMNRIINKIVGTLFLNSRISKIKEHPFWIVGIFKKVDLNEKK
jgi:hypothetical protein